MDAIHQDPSSIPTVGSKLRLNAWSVQTIIYELLSNFMSSNDPEEMGFTFKQKFNEDRLKSDIVLDVGYNWKSKDATKTPACYIVRGDVSLKKLTIGENQSYNVKESEESRFLMNSMQVQLNCVATGLGLTEQFAEYVKQSFITFSQEIKREFGFRRFLLVSISKPSLYLESKEQFVVTLTLDVVYDEGWTVQGQNLKLKTVGRVIFDGITAKPMLNQ